MKSDADLLAAWRSGEQSAGEALVDRYYGAIERFFANKVPEDAMDLIQDTFLGCISGHQRLRQGQHFRSFLFSIAYNKLRKHFECLRIHGERFDPLTQTGVDMSPGPRTMLAQSAEQRLLLAALRRLPLEHQVVLELYYWERLKSAEISEVLGEPHGTVRTRLRRARQLVEQALSEVEGDPELLDATRNDLDGWAAKVRQAYDEGRGRKKGA